MTSPTYWAQAKKELCAKDPVLKNIIASIPAKEKLTSRGDAYFTLARSITGQQISVKAADSIWKRFESGVIEVHPQHVIQAEDTLLRAAGLSHQKIKYLKGSAKWFLENPDHKERWSKAEDEAIIKDLIQLPGIGRWTAEMFMIFHLLKPDVFPIGDIGVIKAVERYYNNGEKMPKNDIITLAEQWRPWRTVATWYLWRALDPVPVEY